MRISVNQFITGVVQSTHTKINVNSIQFISITMSKSITISSGIGINSWPFPISLDTPIRGMCPFIAYNLVGTPAIGAPFVVVSGHSCNWTVLWFLVPYWLNAGRIQIQKSSSTQRGRNQKAVKRTCRFFGAGTPVIGMCRCASLSASHLFRVPESNVSGLNSSSKIIGRSDRNHQAIQSLLRHSIRPESSSKRVASLYPDLSWIRAIQTCRYFASCRHSVVCFFPVSHPSVVIGFHRIKAN